MLDFYGVFFAQIVLYNTVWCLVHYVHSGDFPMSTFSFIQVNNRNLSETVKAIYDCENYTIGFEVLEKEVISELNANIDPQHTGIKLPFQEEAVRNISCAKWVLQRMESIFPADITLCVLPSKLDLDCVVACCLYVNSEEINTWEHNGNEDYQKLLKLCEIVNHINTVDCGLGNVVGNEWNPNHQKQQLLGEITWYQILSAYLADFKVPLEEKVAQIWLWLNNQSLTPFEQWERSVRMEALKQKQSTVTLDPVPFVKSTARGATGMLYSVSPYGVCYNPEYPVKGGTIPKFTICEFTSGKYLDLQGILGEIGELESGWGGNLSAGIIGSPFAGTQLSVQVVCEIVARHIK